MDSESSSVAATPAEDGEDTPTASDSETASARGSGPASRAETPGPMPKYQYSKEDLLQLAQLPAAIARHPCLNKDFDSWVENKTEINSLASRD